MTSILAHTDAAIAIFKVAALCVLGLMSLVARLLNIDLPERKPKRRTFWWLVGPMVAGTLCAWLAPVAHPWLRNKTAGRERFAASAVPFSPRPVIGPSPEQSEAFRVDVMYSQQAAVEKYPDLGISNSPLNTRFLAQLKL